MLKYDKSFIYIELGHNDMWKNCKNVKSVFQNALGITQEDHVRTKFMSLDKQKLEKCDPRP
jgi:hypothetical protein